MLGIDVSAKTLDLCIFDQQTPQYEKVNNDIDGFNSILQIIQSNNIYNVAFEATGTYHKKLYSYLYDNGVKATILDPKSVSLFKKMTKKQSKTDKIDSLAIAQYALSPSPSIIKTSHLYDEFKQYRTLLLVTASTIAKYKNIKHALNQYPFPIDSIEAINATIHYLDTTYNNILDNAYSLLLKRIPCVDLVHNEIKGVGKYTLIFVVPTVYDSLDTHSDKQILSYVGLTPTSFQSGSSVNKPDRLSQHKKPHILKTLYISTVSAIRHNETTRNKFKALRDRGLPAKKAIIACSASLLRAILSKLRKYK